MILRLYHSIVRDHSVLMNDNNAITDGVVWGVVIFPLILTSYPDVATDPGIFVDYSIPDDASPSYTDSGEIVHVESCAVL